jgi:hypothetical protein
MKITKVETWSLRIWIAGDPIKAHAICREYCDSVGFCVSVTPTSYVYTGGDEIGVIVGLINYPRFPSTADEMFNHAKSLGIQLMHQLGQDSFTIETPVETWWFSHRPEDAA